MFISPSALKMIESLCYLWNKDGSQNPLTLKNLSLWKSATFTRQGDTCLQFQVLRKLRQEYDASLSNTGKLSDIHTDRHVDWVFLKRYNHSIYLALSTVTNPCYFNGLSGQKDSYCAQSFTWRRKLHSAWHHLCVCSNTFKNDFRE